MKADKGAATRETREMPSGSFAWWC